MHRSIKPHPHHLRYAACVIAICLVDLCFQHGPHVPRFNTNHWQAHFSNRPSGSSAFRLSTTAVSMSLTGSRFSSDSAPRPFHHGDSKTRWNNLLGGLAVSMTAGPSGQTNSPHPSSREGHHSTVGWSSISSYRI